MQQVAWGWSFLQIDKTIESAVPHHSLGARSNSGP
jgi:hypothetical protein